MLHLEGIAHSSYTALVPVCLGPDTRVALPCEWGAVFGLWAGLDGCSRDAAVDSAAAWLPSLFSWSMPCHAFLAGEVDVGASSIRLVIAPIAASLHPECLSPASPRAPRLVRWLAPSLEPHPIAALLASCAAARAESFSFLRAPVATSLRLGRGGLRTVAGGALATSAADFAAVLARCNLATDSLRASLLDAASHHPSLVFRDFARLCAERVLPLPLCEMPLELRSRATQYDDPELALEPWCHRAVITRRPLPPVHTPPPPPPPVSWPPWCPPPKCQRDMLEDWAFEACFTRLDAFDAWHRDGGASDRPAGEVFGLLAFRSPYRELLALGAVVDWTSGTPRLVGGDAPAFETHVSRAFAAHTFRHSWDQEAASWFQTGVGVNAVGRSPVIALAPNLLSLYPDAAAPVAGQVDEFRRRGWNAAAPPRSRALGALGLPTLPFASNPAGGVSKVGSAEPRVIIHVGWPNKALTIRLPPGFIGPSERYWDTNTLGGPTKPDPDDPYPLFLREFKSTIADAARNSCVLGHACYLGGLTSYEIALDFFKWFHQFFYKERDAWMMGNIAPSLEGSSGALRDALVPILNHVMAMGWRFASGVAQRVGNILVHELYRRFDAIEEKYRHLESPDVLRWLDARSRLPHDSYGRQDRLASVLIYTDDPKAEVASSPPGDPGGAAARAMRLIFELHSLVGPDGLRLILSKHSKWMCAAWTAWIGARFCGTLGLVWVAPDKACALTAPSATLSPATSPTPSCCPSLASFLTFSPSSPSIPTLL